jgi:hypothetical protein
VKRDSFRQSLDAADGVDPARIKKSVSQKLGPGGARLVGRVPGWQAGPFGFGGYGTRITSGLGPEGKELLTKFLGISVVILKHSLSRV